MRIHVVWSTMLRLRLCGQSRHVFGRRRIWRSCASFCLVVSAGVLASPSSATAPVPTARELHTAQCVAALEVSTEELARQVKAGHEELRPVLVSRLEFGTALIGDAYLRGERDEARSQSLLAAAIEAQKTLSDEELSARQTSCAKEGRKVLAEGNVISRAVVSRLAKRRMKKLLGP